MWQLLQQPMSIFTTCRDTYCIYINDKQQSYFINNEEQRPSRRYNVDKASFRLQYCPVECKRWINNNHLIVIYYLSQV